MRGELHGSGAEPDAAAFGWTPRPATESVIAAGDTLIRYGIVPNKEPGRIPTRTQARRAAA